MKQNNNFPKWYIVILIIEALAAVCALGESVLKVFQSCISRCEVSAFLIGLLKLLS